jgi:trehalose 6-phosphate phosphatase
MTSPARGSAPKPIARLFQNWDHVAEQLRAHSRGVGRVAIFLDFDGTLVDIAPRPELVRMRQAARVILQRLARNPRVSIFIVSGRRREELLQQIRVRGIGYFGLYGWESGISSALPLSARTELQRARRQLEHHLRAYPAAWIEDKASSLSLHLLDVPGEEQPRIRRELHGWVRPFRKSLRAVENLRDIEILPRSILGKGAAVRRILAEQSLRGAFPFYFGDDLSDESGFAAVKRGVSVHVGSGRETRARYSVRTPAEVTAALGKLETMLSEKAPKPISEPQKRSRRQKV